MSEEAAKYKIKKSEHELWKEKEVENRHIERALEHAANLYVSYLKDFGIETKGFAFVRIVEPKTKENGLHYITNICRVCLPDALNDVSQAIKEKNKQLGHKHE